MKPLYIIPARGGSKGIPRKNIAMLAGRPLLHYTLDAAVEARRQLGGYILLSTDSEEIADCARDFGMEVPYMRPPELATDTAGSREVILNAMDWAAVNDIDFDTVVLLQPTSPLRTAADIIAACGLFGPEADMVVSVCPSASNPYYNLFETDADGFLHICKGSGLYTRRQDVPPVWEYNGAVYVIRPESIRKMALGEFPRRIPYVMDAARSVDVDTPADLELINRILTSQQ